MGTIYGQGQARLELLNLLSIIGIAAGIMFYIQSGFFNVIVIVIICFSIIIYFFVLAYLKVKMPEKARQEVEGKTFLDFELYRNKEERTSYFFGVEKNQPIKISDSDAKVIEQDPIYIKIQQALIIDTERQLCKYAIEQRDRDEDDYDVTDDNSESSALDLEESHDQIQGMEKTIIEQMTKFIQEKMKIIDENLKKMGETHESLKKKYDEIVKMIKKQGDDATITDAQQEIIDQQQSIDTLESNKPSYGVADKNIVDMSTQELQFRIRTLDECEKAMMELTKDDYLYIQQYRLFQVRKIFTELFSGDVHVEMIKNYQPVTYFDTKNEFERFLLIMRRPYNEEFSFIQTSADHNGFPVVVQSAKATAVTVGWVNSKIPIFIVVSSPADAYRKIDIVQDAKALQSVKEQVLARTVNWYKIEYEQSELAIEEEKAFTNIFLMKYDDLKQKLDETNYEPETTQFVTDERIIKIVPPGIKAFAAVMTVVAIIFIFLAIFFGIQNEQLRALL